MRLLNIAAVILLRCLLGCGLCVATKLQYTSRVSSQCRLPQWFMLYEHVSQINCAYKCAWNPRCSHLSYNNGNQTCAISAVSLNLKCAEDSSGWSLHQLLDRPVVTRAGWGARQAKKVESLKTPVSVVTIHHSGYVDDCQTKQACSKEMRELQNHHLDNLGIDDIRFNFIVGTDGRAYEGRGWDISGQTQGSWDDVALSFSVMGDYSARQPDAEVIQTLKRIIDCGVKLGKITSDYKVYGHRDVHPGYTCPGQQFYEVIKAWEHYGATTPVKPTPIP